MYLIVYIAIAVMLVCIVITCILFYLFNTESRIVPKYKECKCCRVWNADLGESLKYVVMRESLKDMYKYKMISFTEYRRIDARLARTIWRVKYKEANK